MKFKIKQLEQSETYSIVNENDEPICAGAFDTELAAKTALKIAEAAFESGRNKGVNDSTLTQYLIGS